MLQYRLRYRTRSGSDTRMLSTNKLPVLVFQRELLGEVKREKVTLQTDSTLGPVFC
jgi:hypothetical protein